MWCHRHRNNISLLLFCVESSGQCSNTTRALGYASKDEQNSTNFYELKKISKIREFSRLLKLLSHEFSIYAQAQESMKCYFYHVTLHHLFGVEVAPPTKTRFPCSVGLWENEQGKWSNFNRQLLKKGQGYQTTQNWVPQLDRSPPSCISEVKNLKKTWKRDSHFQMIKLCCYIFPSHNLKR